MFSISPAGVLTLTDPTGKVLSASTPQMINWPGYSSTTVISGATTPSGDLQLSIRILNTGKQTIVNPTINLAQFTFVGPTQRTIMSADQAQGMQPVQWYPSTAQPLGCVCAWDGTTGVSVWSPSEKGKPHILYRAINDATPADDPGMDLNFVVQANIAPGKSWSSSVVIRVTNDLSPAGLLSAYKASLPGLSYKPIARPWASWYNGNPLQLNTDAGVFNLLNQLAQARQRYRYPMLAGCIGWGWGGPATDNAGNIYPRSPSANIKSIGPNWNTIRNIVIGGMGLRLGTFIEPGLFPDINSLLSEVDACMSLGITAFYADSCGASWADKAIMYAMQSHCGPDVLVASEQYFDGLQTAAYREWNGTSLSGLNPNQMEHLNYLRPSVDLITLDRSHDPPPQGDGRPVPIPLFCQPLIEI